MDSPLEISVVGVTRGQKGLIINNSPTSELSGSGYTGLLL